LGPDGLNRIKTWTKVDIFSKSAILIPVHHPHHWSLSIITNPNVILSNDTNVDNDLVATHISMDSKKNYDEAEHLESKIELPKRLRAWLNMEWNSKYEGQIQDPFNDKTLPFYELNGKNCFMIVCHKNAIASNLVTYFSPAAN
jgi:Ulp1 family protease